MAKAETLTRVVSASHNMAQQLPVLGALTWTPGESIVDIGCGPGEHCQWFAERGLIPTGVDRNPMATVVRHVTDISQVEPESFDNVFASHVLEHCPDTFATLASWRRLLKPGGRMILVVPPFSQFVSNDHYITGWNAGQLALSMVAAGFDCSKGFFGERGIQVWGVGHKKEFPATGFFFDSAFPYLPTPMRQARVDHGHYQHLEGGIAWCDEHRLEFMYGRTPDPALVRPI